MNRRLWEVQRSVHQEASSRILKERSRRDFEWVTLPSGPSPRLDAGAVQVGHSLYCIAGYESQEHVLGVVDRFDLARCRWADQLPIPTGMPQSHLALTCEEDRYIYSAGGQLGPRCCPAVADVFAFDTLDRVWLSLPPLPESRYAATMQFWRGRLHVLGGSRPDRYTAASEHWSLGVGNGRTAERRWRVEPPIPRGGMHRAAVVDDRLYVFGGQEGISSPFQATPTSPAPVILWNVSMPMYTIIEYESIANRREVRQKRREQYQYESCSAQWASHVNPAYDKARPTSGHIKRWSIFVCQQCANSARHTSSQQYTAFLGRRVSRVRFPYGTPSNFGPR